MFEEFSRPMRIALSVLFISLLVALVLIVLAQQGLLGKKTAITQPAATTSQSQTQNIQPVPLTEVHRVLGTVEKVSGQEITLKDVKKILNTGAPVDQSAQMVITVDQSTLIERFIRKDVMVFGKELEAFGEKQAQEARSSTIPSTPPEPFTLEKVTLGDIKVGDSIVASSAEDISKLTTFTATKIDIQK